MLDTTTSPHQTLEMVLRSRPLNTINESENNPDYLSRYAMHNGPLKFIKSNLEALDRLMTVYQPDIAHNLGRDHVELAQEAVHTMFNDHCAKQGVDSLVLACHLTLTDQQTIVVMRNNFEEIAASLGLTIDEFLKHNTCVRDQWFS